ncbi:UDP-N-acetylglucosamine 2-epimerase (hydrolyzing) [Candidatus Kaiserbacteria bacterium]|nr:UDP-N-acetylglucosamine 2-epimerase (hydrolyzing) [Candidatus Kaiserbacteria bacterium]
MKKKSILVITGTRAEYGLLYETIQALQKSQRLSMRLLVTGMHTVRKYGYTLQGIRRDNIPIACVVPIHEHDTMLQAFAKEVLGIDAYCVKTRPDMILVLGDRGEPLAGAVVAANLNIPVAHIHGGDTSGITTADELVRHSITKLSHLHFPVSPASAKRLRALGEESWRIHMLGAPGIEHIASARFPSRAAVARKHGLDPQKQWILVVHHPTPFEKVPMEKQIRPLLSSLTSQQRHEEKIIVYPNTDTGSAVFIREIDRVRNEPRVHVYPNLERDEYLHLFRHSACIIGNSSSGIIESTPLHVPSITIGSRQDGRSRGKNVISASYDASSIERALRKALGATFASRTKNAKSPYGSGNVGSSIVKRLEKYVCDPRLFHKRVAS